MPYPEKILAEDEKVVARLHPHWITLVPATLWFLVICAALGFAIGFAPSSGTTHTVLIIVFIVVALVLLSRLCFKPWLEWGTTHYIFTTHRVLIRRGLLRHTGRDISLQRINDVAFAQSLWDRIVRAGTLTIESAGEHGQEDLHNIPRSDQVQQLLNRLIEEDGERRARLAHSPADNYPPQGQYQGYPPGQPGQYPQGQPGYQAGPQGQPGQYPPPGYQPGPQGQPGQYPPPGQ